MLAGHEGPVSSVTFSSHKALLASGSWDKTVKLWDVFENKGAKETIVLSSDGLYIDLKIENVNVLSVRVEDFHLHICLVFFLFFILFSSFIEPLG